MSTCEVMEADDPTIGEMIERGELPDEIQSWMNTMGSFADAHLKNFIDKKLPKLLEDYGEEVRKIYRLDMLDMILPDGTRFGDAYLGHLIEYVDMTMDEIAELLVTPPDDEDDEADFIEDGSTPNPNDVDFVTEEELAERDKDIAK